MIRFVRPAIDVRSHPAFLFRAFALAFAPLFATACAPQRPDTVAPLAEALMSTAALPGLSIAILEDGEITYARAWGLADIESGTPATVDTRYRCGSVSKVISITALARLMADGRIDIEAPVNTYVPSWPTEPEITTRQLSGHLAGIAHYQAVDRIDQSHHYTSMDESLDVFRESPRAGPPGERYVYSTHGYTLLSAAIEGAAGTPFLDILEEDVFRPLGMTSSGADMRADPHPEMSALYTQTADGPQLIAQPEDPSYKWAGGGLTSTPSDLVRLGWAYLDGTIPPELVDEMWTSQRTLSGDETGVGIAWRIERDDVLGQVIHHSGGMGGARTTIAIMPETRQVIAVMTNTNWPSDIHTTAKVLLQAWNQGGGDDSDDGPGDSTEGPVEVAVTFGGEPDSATFSLTDGEGWITTPPSMATLLENARLPVSERLPIRHIVASRYGLITPVGIMPIEIEVGEVGVRGSGLVFGRPLTFDQGP